MFKTNESSLDRVLRAVVGLVLLAWFFYDPSMGIWHYAKLIGVVPLLTGLVGTCPIYSILGISTCSMKHA